MTDGFRHIDDASCADLALGLFAGAQRERAVQHAGTCEPCAVRLRSHIAAAQRTLADARSARTRRMARIPAWAMLPVAAAAAVLLVMAWPRTHLPLAKPDTRWLSAPTEGLLLREGQQEDPHLSAGFAAYARQDLMAAERELTAAHATGASEQARRLYLAHVLLLGSRESEALALLRSLSWAELPLAVQRDGVALLARALRATGASASADSLDHALRETPEWVPVLP